MVHVEYQLENGPKADPDDKRTVCKVCGDTLNTDLPGWVHSACVPCGGCKRDPNGARPIRVPCEVPMVSGEYTTEQGIPSDCPCLLTYIPSALQEIVTTQIECDIRNLCKHIPEMDGFLDDLLMYVHFDICIKKARMIIETEAFFPPDHPTDCMRELEKLFLGKQAEQLVMMGNGMKGAK